MAIPQKSKHKITVWSSNSTPTYLPKKNENISSHKTLYTNIHSSIIYNGLKVETQMSIH